MDIGTTIEIAAPAERVWAILTDFPSYPQWNPFITRLSGEAKAGTRLDIYLQPPGGGGMGFRPVVLRAQPNRELRWLGRVWLPGIFDGEHWLILTPLGESRVRLEHGERFSGLLAPIIMRFLRDNTQRGFAAMDQALKAKAEAEDPGGT